MAPRQQMSGGASRGFSLREITVRAPFTVRHRGLGDVDDDDDDDFRAWLPSSSSWTQRQVCILEPMRTISGHERNNTWIGFLRFRRLDYVR